MKTPRFLEAQMKRTTLLILFFIVAWGGAHVSTGFAAEGGFFNFDICVCIPQSVTSASSEDGVSVTLGPSTRGTEPTSTLVRITTSDGKEVKQLFLGTAVRGAGKTFEWDGTDRLGNPVPAGTYLLEVTASGYHYSEQIVHTPGKTPVMTESGETN